jgi:chromate reductase
MKTYDVAVLVGSLRRESINRRLAPPTLALREVPLAELPMYNGDLESQRPDSVNRFTAEVARADAVLMVMPEYNRSLPAVLKNAIDWGSKPMDRNVWRDKPLAMAGTSPGAIGTAVGQQHLRQIMGILGAVVLGGEAYLSFKPGLIDADGAVSDESTAKFLAAYIARFAALTERLAAR